jgi:murein DD-endopeptidase MepM/ murein hydrolase activator NlpD
LRVGKLGAFTGVCACAVLAGLVGYHGFRIGSDATFERIFNNPETSTQFWQSELISQRRLINDIGVETDQSLSALALNLGQLRAHVVRLDALGSRLTEMAKLDPSEFDFTAEPALGGPTPTGQQSSVNVRDLAEEIERIAGELSDRTDKLTALESLLMSRKLQGATHPEGRPVSSGWISSGFGNRTDPMSGKSEFHRGVDFAGKWGSDIVAVAAGVVTWSGKRFGHGNSVEISHGNGYTTRYSHNLENLVKKGDKVEKDQVIAKMGSSGRSTGSHIHFEVLEDGKIVNPGKFITSAKR